MAPSTSDSPDASFPLGRLQSPYLGRWITATSTAGLATPPSASRQRTPPAARIVSVSAIRPFASDGAGASMPLDTADALRRPQPCSAPPAGLPQRHSPGQSPPATWHGGRYA